ncbi:dihydrolipoamide acetyltransferase family protein [Prauserella endophytica]|uniref:Dihydrolipoamide acetyltransferase component of pyruvate dehydrogenase complex n=1 Tax=Prauserella endophytica TaxID=1592324 RepID=A0ABY2S6J9_9PSEU|nr:dihydrolipoamide acetyltransferase family protein [Prauserella endophytica]TKG71472.1 2-oxo acid dehydrogenase subunit E2 [Prauserella endophytica]
MVAKEVALVMPKMSMTMTEGVLVGWRKAEGDQVRQGEVVCEVTTDKVDMEVESNVDGVLTRLVAEPEDVIGVGEPIAFVASEADDLLEGLFDGPPEPAPEPSPEAEPPAAVAVETRPRNGVAAVPAARRRAADLGVDLATVPPTGPWHTIRLSDVEHFGREQGSFTTAKREQSSLAPVSRRRKGARTAIARRMAASAQVPQFVLYRDIDLQRAGENRRHGWTAVFTHVLAGALREHPELNASWVDGEVRAHEHVGVALAVDTGRGLLAPVLTDPDQLSLDALAARITDVVDRARAGRLGLAELSAPATTTVSNLGGLGVGAFQALLTPPQATALALGAIEPKVVPVPGGIGVSLRCTVGLSVDHRVGDGADGARLLTTVQRLLDGELV